MSSVVCQFFLLNKPREPVMIPPFTPKSKLFYFMDLRNEMIKFRVDLATLWDVSAC